MKRTARSPSSPRSARLSRSRRHAGSVLKHSCALAVTDIHPGRREPGRSGLQLESAAAVASARGRANPGQLPCALAEAARACRQDPGPAPRALRLPVQEPAVLHGSFHSESGGEADGWVALDVDWRDDRCVKFGKRTRRGWPSRVGGERGCHGAVGTSQIALTGIARRRGPKERVCCPVYMTRPTMKSSPSR